MVIRIFGFHIFILRKDVKTMAAIYFALITVGLYKYEDVNPYNGVKDKVREMLLALGYEDLVTD